MRALTKMAYVLTGALGATVTYLTDDLWLKVFCAMTLFVIVLDLIERKKE